MQLIQCRLTQKREDGGVEVQYGYIDAEAAVLGYRVELKGLPGFWTVEIAAGPPVEAKELQEKQRVDRRGLPSIC